MQREEPYQGLTFSGQLLEIGAFFMTAKQVVHGCRQLVL